MKKSMLNSKIKLLKKSAGTQKSYPQRNTLGVTLVNVNAPVVATTSWWWHFYALVMA